MAYFLLNAFGKGEKMIQPKFGICAFFILTIGTTAIAGSVPKATPALIEKGKGVYITNCATCHGDHGDGNGVAGAYMNPKPRNLIKDKFKLGDKPEQVFKTISEGLPGTSMVGFGQLSEEDRWATTHYILSTFRKKKTK